ncbi:MAG: DUF1778 domain-containing protein [Longimicrobiales bacterium]
MTTKSSQLQIRVTPAQKAALKRLAARAGADLSSYVLSRALPPSRARLHEVLDALRGGADRRYALAELNDLLTELTALELPAAVAGADLEGLGPVERNYVAAMVEQASVMKGVEPPAWAGEVEPLAEPYFATSLGSLREHLLRSSPVAFKRRNIFVDATVGDRV